MWFVVANVAVALAGATLQGGLSPKVKLLISTPAVVRGVDDLVLTMTVQNAGAEAAETSLDQTLVLQFMNRDASFDLKGTTLVHTRQYAPAVVLIDRRYAPVGVPARGTWRGTYRLADMIDGLRPGRYRIPFSISYRYRLGDGPWETAVHKTTLAFEIKH